MAEDILPDPPDQRPSAATMLPASHLGVSSKTYAATLAPAPTVPAISAPSVGLHKGLPSIAFEDSQIQTLSAPYGRSLIGKFAKGFNKSNPKMGRPSTEEIRKHLVSMDFVGGFSVGLLDNRHVWIRFTTETDYLRLYSRPVWHINGMTMRMFRWTPYFRVDIESSLVPVWVRFPRLPVQFFHKNALLPIASLLGLPLRVDSATASLKRPSVARIQVEIDLLKPLPDKIWITVGRGGGYWQKVEYESVPPYCSHCMHVGHKEQVCTVHNPELQPQGGPQSTQWVPKPIVLTKPKQPEGSNTGRIIPELLVANSDQHHIATVDRHPSSQIVNVDSTDDVPVNVPSFQQHTVVTAPQIDAADSIVKQLELHPRKPPVIFCGDSDLELDEEITLPPEPSEFEPTLPASSESNLLVPTVPLILSTISEFPVLPTLSPTPNFSSSIRPSLASPFVPSVWSPGVVFPKPTIFCGDDTSQRSAQEPSGQLLNSDAAPWHPQDPGKSVLAAPFQSGRTLPKSFQPTYSFDAPDDDSNSWRTFDSAEENAEGEDSGNEDSLEEFLDSPHTRDDTYLAERRTRQSRRERETVLMRRGRGRPLGSRNRTFSDSEHPFTKRQSGRNNKGVSPKHYEPGL